MQDAKEREALHAQHDNVFEAVMQGQAEAAVPQPSTSQAATGPGVDAVSNEPEKSTGKKAKGNFNAFPMCLIHFRFPFKLFWTLLARQS